MAEFDSGCHFISKITQTNTVSIFRDPRCLLRIPMVTHMIKLYTFFECFEKESSPVAEFVGILFLKFVYFCTFFWLALDSRLSE